MNLGQVYQSLVAYEPELAINKESILKSISGTLSLKWKSKHLVRIKEEESQPWQYGLPTWRNNEGKIANEYL